MGDRSLWRFEKQGAVVVVSGFVSGLLWASLALAEEIPSGLGHSVAHVSPGGLSVYRAEKWGLLNLHLQNPTDTPLELLATTFFQGESALQYGRRVWVPPHSRLQTWHPLRLPRSATGQSLNTLTLVMDARQEREVLLRGDHGYLQIDGNLRGTDEDSVTALIEGAADLPLNPISRSALAPGSDVRPDREPDASAFRLVPDENLGANAELVVTSRLEAQRTRRMASLLDHSLPPSAEAFQALDHLVLADSRLTNDSAGLAATRRWLFGGGRLWVMLDQVDPSVLARLLGDEFVCEIIDRVGLTTVQLADPQAGGKVVSTQEYEQPVEFVRVAVSEVEVVYTVDSWPAAFWKTCGEGRLLVTTLGPRGWMRRRTANDANSVPNPRRQRFGGESTSPMLTNAIDELRAPTAFTTLPPMSTLAQDFFATRLPPLLPDELLGPLTQEYVGYAIPSRTLILGLLLGFSLLLLSLGAWLWRRNRLELLGAIGPGLALGISVILVLLGRQQRNAVPPTVASLQIVQPISGTDDVRIAGVAGLYAPDAGTATISAEQGGWLLPDSSGLDSTTRRMVWTDQDAWQWEHLPETAGIRRATFQATTEQPARLEAHATFGPEGLTGRVHLPREYRPTDAILATREGRFGVELHDDGKLTALANNVLADDQFLAAGLLSDEQSRRRRLLQQLLANPLRRDYPEVPHLFLWTEPWDTGFRFGEQRRSMGSALLAVPLKLQRPAVGTEVRLASPLLPFRVTIGPDDSAPPAWWDAPRLQWIEKSQPTETWLRFQIPTVLLPIAVDRGRVTVRVKGPVGKVALAGYRLNTNAIVPLKTWSDPVGTLSLDITDPELLAVSADGGLLLHIAAGDKDRPELTQREATDNSIMSYWQIESLTLELHAKTIAPVIAVEP